MRWGGESNVTLHRIHMVNMWVGVGEHPLNVMSVTDHMA